MNDRAGRALVDFADEADRLGVRYVLVGAGSRLLWAMRRRAQGRAVSLPRATLDWDFGVMLDNSRELGRIVEELCRTLFGPGRSSHKLVHKDSEVEFDLIPFGGIAPDGRLDIPDEEKTMNVLGFEEAWESAHQVEAGGRRIRVVRDAAFVALKLLAWDDRRADRDLTDIWEVIRDYDQGDNLERAYDLFNRDILERGLTPEEFIPLLLGRDMGRIMSARTREAVEAVLSRLAEDPNGCRPLARLDQPLDTFSHAFRFVLEGVRTTSRS